jgi:hypothetical protein
MVSGTSCPWLPTGWAAPVFVSGAIAAKSPESRMKKPAEAARAPDGDTNVATGVFALTMPVVISRIDVMSPPGVEISITRSAARRSCASVIARATNPAAAGWISPSSRATRTSGREGPAEAAAAERSAGRSAAASAASTGILRFNVPILLRGPALPAPERRTPR